MRANGIRPGDHVGILASNRPEYLPIRFACTLVGAVAAPLNARFRTQELRHVVRHCDLSWIVLGNLDAVLHAEVLQANMAGMPLATHISAYGMTELSGITSHNDPADPAGERLGNCGQPYPGIEVSIQDAETGALRGRGEQGEICVRGFSVFSGYYRQPEENDKAFDAEGWVHRGVLGLLDEQGRICFRERLKDLLKVGGENVSPLEVEAWLSTHPDIIMAKVIGAPDRRLDKVPAAFIELTPTARVSEQDTIDYCTGQVA